MRTGILVLPTLVLLAHLAIFGRHGAMVVGTLALTGLIAAVIQRRRQIVSSNRMVVVIGAVVLVAELLVAYRLMTVKERIREALAATDPCSAPPADLVGELTDEDRIVLSERKTRCDDHVVHDHCDAVGRVLDTSSSLDDVTSTWLATERQRSSKAFDTGALVERLRVKAPVRNDLLIKRNDLVCTDAIWSRLVKRLAEAVTVWSEVETVGDEMKAAVKAVGLTPDSKSALRTHTENTAKREPSLLANLCGLVTFFDAGPTAACTTAPEAIAEGGASSVSDSGNAPIHDSGVREEIRLFQACITSCAKDRTPEARAADEELAKKSLEAKRECYVRCNGDGPCQRRCETAPRPGVSSLDACIGRCKTDYPRWNAPLF